LEGVTLPIAQELVAPGDSGAHGALPFGEVTIAMREQGKPRIQALLELAWRDGSDMRRGELYGERQSVELTADFLHIEHQRLVLDERRIALAGAIEEEPDSSWKLRFSRRGRRLDGERSDGEEPLVL